MLTLCAEILRPVDLGVGCWRSFFSKPVDIRTAYGYLAAKKLCEETQGKVSEIQILDSLKESLPASLSSFQGPRLFLVPVPSKKAKPIIPTRIKIKPPKQPRDDRDWAKAASYDPDQVAFETSSRDEDDVEESFQETKNILEEKKECADGKTEVSKGKTLTDTSSASDEKEDLKDQYFLKSPLNELSSIKMKSRTTQDLVPSERVQNVEFHSSARNPPIMFSENKSHPEGKSSKTKSALESLFRTNKKNPSNFELADGDVQLLSPAQIPNESRITPNPEPSPSQPVMTPTDASKMQTDPPQGEVKKSKQMTRHDYFRETTIVPTLDKDVPRTSTFLEFKKNRSKKLTAKRTFYVQLPPASEPKKVVKRKIIVQGKSNKLGWRTEAWKETQVRREAEIKKPRPLSVFTKPISRSQKHRSYGSANLSTQSSRKQAGVRKAKMPDTTEEVLERIFKRSNKIRD